MRISARSSESGLRSRTAGTVSRSLRSVSGDWKLQPIASLSPAPTSASAARRRSFCSTVSRPLMPWPGIVAGSFSSPHSRATSSIRSTSRVTSLRRNAGTVTSSPSPASTTPNSSRSRMSRCSPIGTAVPSRPVTFSSRSVIVFGAGPGPPTSTVPGFKVAPQSSIISCAASAWPSIVYSGASPFSKRPEASVRSPSR